MKRVIINLSGKKRTGKETIFKLMLSYLSKPVEFQFATPLKKFCMDVLGLTYAQCYGSTLDRESLTKYRWGDVIEAVRLKYDKSPDEHLTARQVLQVVGTHLMRNQFYNDIWAYAGIRDAVASTAHSCIFTDSRFPNELMATREAKNLDPNFEDSIIIRLYRETGYNDNDESETAVDYLDFSKNQRRITPEMYATLEMCGYKRVTETMWAWRGLKPIPIFSFDYIIDNNGTLDNLRENVLFLLKERTLFMEPSLS